MKYGEATTAYAYVANQLGNRVDPTGLIKGQAKVIKMKMKNKNIMHPPGQADYSSSKGKATGGTNYIEMTEAISDDLGRKEGPSSEKTAEFISRVPAFQPDGPSKVTKGANQKPTEVSGDAKPSRVTHQDVTQIDLNGDPSATYDADGQSMDDFY